METNEVTLKWEDPNLIEKGHRIYRSDKPMAIDDLPTPHATINKDATMYVDEELPVGNTYYYRVSAWINGYEEVSEEVVVTVAKRTHVFVAFSNIATIKRVAYDGTLGLREDIEFDAATAVVIPDEDNNAYIAHGSEITKTSRNGELLWTYNGHSGKVNDISLSVNNILVSGSDDNTVHVVDMSDGSHIHTFTGFTNRVTAVSISGFNTYMVAGDNTGVMKAVDPRTFSESWSKSIHSAAITSLYASDEGDILSASSDGTVKMIDVSTGNSRWTYSNGSVGINDVAIGANGDIYAVDNNGRCHRISNNGKHEWGITLHNGKATSVAIDDQGFIYTGGDDGTVHMIESDGSTAWTHNQYDAVINSVRVSSRFRPPRVEGLDATVYTLKTPNNADEVHIYSNATVFSLKAEVINGER